MWSFSGRILPIVILVVIPLIVTILSYQTNQPTIYAFFGYEIVPIDSLYILSFVYALYPIRYTSKEFFKKTNSKSAINEFRYVKSILYVIIPTFIATFFIITIFDKFGSVAVQIIPYDYYIFLYDSYIFLYDSYILALGANLSYSVIAGIIWLLIHVERKDFRFYYAKATFSIISEKMDEMSKARYLLTALKSYDNYLQKNLRLQINEIGKTYSKIIFDSNVHENEVISSLGVAFDSDDTLKPAKYLSKISHVPEDFLIDKSAGQKVKDLAIFFATVIPVVIAIVQLLFPSPK